MKFLLAVLYGYAALVLDTQLPGMLPSGWTVPSAASLCAAWFILRFSSGQSIVLSGLLGLALDGLSATGLGTTFLTWGCLALVGGTFFERYRLQGLVASVLFVMVLTFFQHASHHFIVAIFEHGTSGSASTILEAAARTGVATAIVAFLGLGCVRVVWATWVVSRNPRVGLASPREHRRYA